MLVLAAAARPAGAAEQRLGEVVVTAPSVGEPRAAEDPTAFATVIETAAAPTEVKTLTEALADAVGVQVRRFGGLGDFSTVSIRGSSAGQVQVYLDGVPLSRAENEVVNLADLPLDAVDHVEVYRGATPLAFAQSGPGGVVNVVSRRAGGTPVTGVSTSYGSFETRKVDVARAASAGPWDYLAFAHYLGSAGDFAFTNDLGTTANPADDRTERRRNNAFDLGDLTARLGYRSGGPLAAVLTSDSFVKDEGVPGAGSVQARDARLRTLRQLAHLDMKLTPLGGLPLDADASGYFLYDRQAFTDRRGEVSFVPVDHTDTTTAGGVQALFRSAIGAHQVPGLLVAASHERFASSDRLDPAGNAPDRSRLRTTFAAEDEVLLAADRLSIVPGLRWEVFRDDFPGTPRLPVAARASGVSVRDFLSPRLGLRVEPVRGLTFLANLGRYAREPNLEELFGTRGVVIGNPSLRPEVAFNRDAGFHLAVPGRGPLSDAALEYAYFDNQVDDLIILVQNSQRLARPENVSDAVVRGHEVAVRGRLWDRLGAALNYTHQEARDEGPVTFLRGKALPGRPADEAFAHLELAWSPTRPLPLGHRTAGLWPGRLFYEANVIADDFLDRANVRRVSSRVLHEVGLELALPVPGVRLTLEAKNVGDDRTRDVLGFPLPGRALFATVSYGFGGRDVGAAR
ncbi:MAG: TonB-dependent receptor [Deltaproteobacteria bacterium]|nr:MAG: TonB-dependent receptor [Deltaproteobacteria bacterium]